MCEAIALFNGDTWQHSALSRSPMTDHPSTKFLRSLIPPTTSLTAATLNMDNGTTINMAIGGDVSAFWAAVDDYCGRYDDQRPFVAGTIWLSNDSWIAHEYDIIDGELYWVHRSRPVVPPELLQADRLCACGCGRKLSKVNRSGWSADCYTANPDVRSRLAANRQAARARSAKAKQ
jgi:hypothetical protein